MVPVKLTFKVQIQGAVTSFFQGLVRYFRKPLEKYVFVLIFFVAVEIQGSRARYVALIQPKNL